jgi:hypothetical protein
MCLKTHTIKVCPQAAKTIDDCGWATELCKEAKKADKVGKCAEGIRTEEIKTPFGLATCPCAACVFLRERQRGFYDEREWDLIFR